METQLGYIKSARFGFGGYQDAMVGLSLEFAGESWGCGHFIGAWAIKRSAFAKWTEEDRARDMAATVRSVQELLEQAKKRDVSDLRGVPVEVTFEAMTFKSFRVLTEVIPQ